MLLIHKAGIKSVTKHTSNHFNQMIKAKGKVLCNQQCAVETSD